MLYRMFSAAVFAAVLGPISATAQNIAQIGGPAERPPSSYKGLQYVDSRGCVFMRVESSGAAKWYPRVDAQRKPVCNIGPAPKAEVATAQDAPAAPAVTMMAPVVTPKPIIAQGKAPLPTVASNMMPEALAAPAPASSYATVAAAPAQAAPPLPVIASASNYERVTTTGSKGQIICSTSAPVVEVVRLRNGGTGVMCTRGDGTTNGWHAPTYPSGSPLGASLQEPVLHAPAAQKPRQTVTAAARQVQPSVQAQTIFTPPQGYKLAWKDDRLNPLRGIGTAQGQAAQDRVWTRRVPAQIVTGASLQRVQASRVTISSMSAAEQATGRSFVQIGTFGVAANAAGAAARLQALGLPVAKSNLVKAGKPLQIVLAGPFGSADQAQAALRKARQAGFGDAFLRN